MLDRLSLRARLLVLFLAPTLLLLVPAGFLGYRFARSVLEQQLGESLSAVAAAIASEVSAERLLSLTPEDAEGEGSRTYRNLLRPLKEAKSSAELRRVYAFDREGRMRLDVGGNLPVLAEVPELQRDHLELIEVWAGKRNHSQVLFEGTDGQPYKTGYAPLWNGDRVVGAIAVEGSATFYGPMKTLARWATGLGVLVVLLLTGLALMTARTLGRPLEQLVTAALRISKGDLDTKVEPQPTPEIGILARELEAMRDALQARDRQLKMMLGGVAHEVKNPLGGMELFAGLLREELGSEKPSLDEARGHVDRVQRELDYLKRIVDDFLAFARERKLAKQPFDAPQWVQGAVEHLKGDAAAKQVTLACSAEAATLEGDASLLTSALLNLVKNAVQASPTGRAVKVSGKKGVASYRVEVEDEGGGIPSELQPRIFEPFFTTREKGTGLGLPLARKLAEAHGGTLTVESAPGRTVFSLTLPG